MNYFDKNIIQCESIINSKTYILSKCDKLKIEIILQELIDQFSTIESEETAIACEIAASRLPPALLSALEKDARLCGIRQLTLTASKTAEKLYRRAGYLAEPYKDVHLPNGGIMSLCPMKKELVVAKVCERQGSGYA